MTRHTVELQQLTRGRVTTWQWVCECGESDDNLSRQAALEQAREHIDANSSQAEPTA